MTENDKLRGIEIRFYLIIADLVKMTNPPNLQNVFAFLDFIEAIDFTKSIDCDIIKTLTQKIYNENTNIQPNRIELCNFIKTHKLPLKSIQKYIKLDSNTYRAITSRINTQTFYQPTHLQPPVYATLQNFLNIVKKITNFGVEKLYDRTKQ